MNQLFFQLGRKYFSHNDAVVLNTANTITSHSFIADGEIITSITIALANSEVETLIRYLARQPDSIIFETVMKKFKTGTHFGILLHNNTFHIHHHL